MKGERGIVGDQGRKGDKGGKGESAKQDKQVQYHKPTGNNVCGAKKVHSFLNFPIIWFFLNEKRKTIMRDKTIPGHMDKDNTNLRYLRVFKHLEVILTGVVSINHNHYTGLLALTTICLVCLILFQDCVFNKLQSSSALRVLFLENMGVYGSNSKCNRWYLKFNGNECSGPMAIEAAVYNHWPSGTPTPLHQRSFEGYCENIAQGAVRVDLWVGKCSGQSLGNANTGWGSVSRIIIEEVSRPQS